MIMLSILLFEMFEIVKTRLLLLPVDTHSLLWFSEDFLKIFWSLTLKTNSDSERARRTSCTSPPLSAQTGSRLLKPCSSCFWDGDEWKKMKTFWILFQDKKSSKFWHFERPVGDFLSFGPGNPKPQSDCWVRHISKEVKATQNTVRNTSAGSHTRCILFLCRWGKERSAFPVGSLGEKNTTLCDQAVSLSSSICACVSVCTCTCAAASPLPPPLISQMSKT